MTLQKMAPNGAIFFCCYTHPDVVQSRRLRQRAMFFAPALNEKRPPQGAVSFMSFPVCSSGERRQLNLDAAVLRAAFRSRVGRNRASRTKTGNGKAPGIDALGTKVVGDRQRATL